MCRGERRTTTSCDHVSTREHGLYIRGVRARRLLAVKPETSYEYDRIIQYNSGSSIYWCMYELRVELESKMIREKRKKLNDKRAELYSELGSVASRF